MTPPVRIYLADDHALVREAIATVLHRHPGYRVVGEGGDGQAVLDDLARTEVDLLLLDISMPGPGFPELMAELRPRHPALKILVVSMHPESLYAERALRAGAAGYLCKTWPAAELESAIAQVLAGATYVSGNGTGTPHAHDVAPGSEDWRRLFHLSARELEILLHLAAGGGITQIARTLVLSPKTVSTYRLRLLRKLGLSTNAELVRFALQQRLIA